MPSLLDSHLEQISLCATSIAELPFPGPKAFTNALLSQHEITSLIRDTESHERALFHLAPPPLPNKPTSQDFVLSNSGSNAPSTTSRRATVYGTRQPKNRAVAAVLGGDLYRQTRSETSVTRQKGEVDVELLLQGAEKLATVYPIAGANDKITQLRRRHQQLKSNITHYESKVNEQMKELEKINRPSSRQAFDQDEDGEGDHVGDGGVEPAVTTPAITMEDLEREEAEIQRLEQKKRSLEQKVAAMERDLENLS